MPVSEHLQKLVGIENTLYLPASSQWIVRSASVADILNKTVRGALRPEFVFKQLMGYVTNENVNHVQVLGSALYTG